MLALVTVLLCLGVLLIAGALLFLVVRFSNQWALLTLRRHPPTPIADPTGRIAVDPRMFNLPTGQEPVATEAVRLTDPPSMPPVVPRDVIDDLRRGERLTLSEVRLPRGRDVFALGRPHDGTLVPSRGTLSIFTTDGRVKVLADRVEDVKVALGAALVMLLAGAVLTGGWATALNYAG